MLGPAGQSLHILLLQNVFSYYRMCSLTNRTCGTESPYPREESVTDTNQICQKMHIRTHIRTHIREESVTDTNQICQRCI